MDRRFAIADLINEFGRQAVISGHQNIGILAVDAFQPAAVFFGDHERPSKSLNSSRPSIPPRLVTVLSNDDLALSCREPALRLSEKVSSNGLPSSRITRRVK